MSDDKVKVSMFLAAPIAQAVKIRAARDSTGVSETISNMFQCAHCRETITDEFIIGKPTQIAPNRYAVFFHKNRKECAEASGTEIRFFMKCPSCHEQPMQTFDPSTLKKLIHAKTVEFYCISCDKQWKASAKDLQLITAMADKPPSIAPALILEADFHLGDERTGDGCFIWADATTGKRIRFDIPRNILLDVLGSTSAFANEQTLKLCERERTKVSLACQRAFRRSPQSSTIILTESDFRSNNH